MLRLLSQQRKQRLATRTRERSRQVGSATELNQDALLRLLTQGAQNDNVAHLNKFDKLHAKVQ
jgi:hypothetical protein